MRTLLPLLSLATLSTACIAQDNPMQQAMAQHGVTAEADNSPFVPNTFTGSYRMEMHMFKKGAEETNSPMNMRYAFKADMSAMNMESTDERMHGMRMIFDLQNKFQYMLMDDGKGKKTAMKQRLQTYTVDADKQKDGSEMKISVTDEYKTIDGHKCRKITGENNDSKGEWWVAEDVPINMADVMRTVRMKGRSHDEYARFGGKGLPMEMTFEKKDGSDKIVMNTKDVVVGTVDANAFDMSGYQVMDMTAMPGFGGH